LIPILFILFISSILPSKSISYHIFLSPLIKRLWEIRKTYLNKQALLADIQSRAGRSILHELSDDELQYLSDYIDYSIGDDMEAVVERDRWTLIKAVK